MIIIAANDGQFRKLSAALGRAELADDDRFATVASRNQHRGSLRPLLEELLAHRSAAEWFDILTAAGVACGPVNTVEGGVKLAERLGLDPAVVADGVPTVRNPIRLSASPVTYRYAPPELDGDASVIRAWLDDPDATL